MKKEVLSSLDYDAMKKIQGGGYCDVIIDTPTNPDMWGSRVCGTYWKTGGCSGAGNSKSCEATVIFCTPI